MISVIIPAFNEEEELPETFRHLALNSVAYEIIVADGGSTDDTFRISQEAGAIMARCPRRQRAAQMNAGASMAKGESFLFLHADTWVNSDSLTNIEEALAKSHYVGGGFARRFRGSSTFLRMTCLLADLRCHAFGWFLGDQGLFVRSEVFKKMGGFADRVQFEDLDFSRRMKTYGKLAMVKSPVYSSARRFKDGAASRTLRDVQLTAKYLIER